MAAGTGARAGTRRWAVAAAAAAAVAVVVVVGLAAVSGVQAVDRSKFKTCKDASFCRRHRDTTSFPEAFIYGNTVKETASGLSAELVGGEAGAPSFGFEVRLYDMGVARVRVTEDSPSPRWESPDVILESGLKVASWSRQDTAPTGVPAVAGEGTYLVQKAITGHTSVIAIQYRPFKLTQYVDGSAVTTMNSRGLFHFEHRRTRSGGAKTVTSPSGTEYVDNGKKIVDWGEDGRPVYEDGSHGELPAATAQATTQEHSDEAGMWEETFQSHRDSKPFGPTAVSCDITFHNIAHVYGIPEHASSLSLKTTDGSSGGYSEPYRLYNLDVFEYEMDEPMALYGSIPIMLGHNTARTAGVFWNNPTETYVDISKDSAGTHTRWISESGIIDLMLMPGPSSKQVFGQIASLVGSQALPPLFSLGYHQSRWNYRDEADVANVDSKFEEHNFPYDVMWLDIEHTDGKRYFTWDKYMFPNPAEMQRRVAAHGRKMVTIVDPHIKRDPMYYIHQEALARKLYIKSATSDTEFEGWCWPGSSSYPDFTNPEVREWWGKQFRFDKYEGSTEDLFIWNDMNEPSVFNGPEVSMQKDNRNLDGVEHREWHNLYGFYYHMASSQGVENRFPDRVRRPFVLSRAFYAGSQRFGAIWTGDNQAQWSHLAAAAPMIMSIGVAGLPFAGADVGGFMGNPDEELLTRWYQAAAFQPFFRGHAHIDTKRREPWLFSTATLDRIRTAVRERYSYLPLWYTLFFEAYSYGTPVMRPVWVEFPTDEATFGMEDQWMVGGELMVKAVTSAGAQSTSVYLPGETMWYDAYTQEKLGYGGRHVSISTPMERIAVLQRGGAIVPRQMRPRRCATFMGNDPYTLVIALDQHKKARGSLFLDDGVSFEVTKGEYLLREFTFDEYKLTSVRTEGHSTYSRDNAIERIVVLGLGRNPSRVSWGTTDLTASYDAARDVLTVRKPGVNIGEDFEILFM